MKNFLLRGARSFSRGLRGIRMTVLALLLAATALFTASPAWGQANVSGNQVGITQGGNVAAVDAGNALKINVGELGGTALPGAQVVDVTNTAFRVNCVTGCSSSGGSSLADAGTFTQGTTSFTVAGGFFNSTITNLVSGQGGAVRLTADRMMFVNLGEVGASAISLGQAAMASSLPVAIASNQSAIPVSQSGTWTVQPGNTANTTAWLVTGTGGTFPATQSGTWNVGLNAGTALVGAISPNWGCGTTAYNQALAAVPTTLTAATTTTTCLSAATFCNTNASAQTISLEDNQATKIIAVNAASVPALSCYTYPFYGAKFTSGINWLAGGTGVTGALIGVQ